MNARRHWLNGIADGILFLLVYGGMTFLLEWFKWDFGLRYDAWTAAAGLLTAIPYFAVLAIRRTVKKRRWVAGAILAVVMAVMLPPYDASVKAFAMPIVITAVIRAVFTRPGAVSVFASDKTLFGLVVAFNIVLTVIAQSMAFAIAPVVLAASSFAVAAGYVLAVHMENANMALNHLDPNSQPVDRILGFNNRIMLAFVGLLLAVGWLVGFMPMSSVADVLAAWGRMLYGYLYQLITNREPRVVADREPSEPITALPGGEPREQAFFKWRDLSAYEIWIFNITVVVMSIVFLYVFVRVVFWLYRRLRVPVVHDMDEKAFMPPDTDIKTRLDGFRRKIAYDPNQRVRRMYFKKVSALIRKGADVRLSDTAGEIAEKTLAYEDLRPLTAQYEAVRYGRET